MSLIILIESIWFSILDFVYLIKGKFRNRMFYDVDFIPSKLINLTNTSTKGEVEMKIGYVHYLHRKLGKEAQVIIVENRASNETYMIQAKEDGVCDNLIAQEQQLKESLLLSNVYVLKGNFFQKADSIQMDRITECINNAFKQLKAVYGGNYEKSYCEW